MRNLTWRLGAARNAGTAPEVLSAAAWAEQLLSVPGPEPMKRVLKVAVAELHMEAAWAGFDCWRHNRAMHHFRTALNLATEAGDAYLQAEALLQAGLAIREFGHPSRLDASEVEMTTARELWSATRADTYGDLDRPAALLALRRGQLDVAEPLAAASVHRWEGINQRGHAMSSIVLATVHVRAGESGGLPLAHHTITAVSKLSSVRARKRLRPLAAALSARPGRDAQHLSRLAKAVASTDRR